MSSQVVTLIQCTNSKRDSVALARNLYDESRYFRLMRAWAEDRGDPWFILSAKHGLVPPPRRITAPYNERGLTGDQADQISRSLHRLGVETVHITAGRDYTEPLIPRLESFGMDVIHHFAGEPIGRREKLLREATE